MKFQLIFLFFFSINLSLSQSIKGRVVDEADNPIPGANIYYDGTSIGTTTNERGFFELNNTIKTNASLVISYIGYQTLYFNTLDDSKSYIFKLKETVNELNEVIIKKDRFTRAQKLNLFREQFLGSTKAGRSAKIVNEDVLEFEYDEVKKSLTATADQPIMILNPILGYRVFYEISNFIVTFNKLSIDSKDVFKVYFTGVTQFKEIDNSEKVKIERQKSFNGSAVHFFRSLANNKLSENKFLLKKKNKEIVFNQNFIVKDTLGFKQITLINEIKNHGETIDYYHIIYGNKDSSTININTNIFYIDQFGINTNVNQILFTGDIGVKRIADMLPTNYGINSIKN